MIPLHLFEWYFNILSASHCPYAFSCAATFTRTGRPDHSKTTSCTYSRINKRHQYLFIYTEVMQLLTKPLWYAPCSRAPEVHDVVMGSLLSSMLQVKRWGRNGARVSQRNVFGGLEQVFPYSFWESSLVLWTWMVVTLPQLGCSPIPVGGVKSVHTRGWTGLNKHCKISSSAMCQ